MKVATVVFASLLAAVNPPSSQARQERIAPQPCAILGDLRVPGRVITIDDLYAVRACRTGRAGLETTRDEMNRPAADESDPSNVVDERGGAQPRSSSAEPRSREVADNRRADERDWRARWRAVDARSRKLLRDAAELRAEAAEAPRDPKRRPVGRRSSTALVRRAEAMEREARELEDRFAGEARRAGALPGWLREERR
jgi:hypothetical protein